LSADESADTLRKKVMLTLVGELYSLISGTPDERIEGVLVNTLHELFTTHLNRNEIMGVTEVMLKLKRKRIEELVEALEALHEAG
jgi:hypothetical protein